MNVDVYLAALGNETGHVMVPSVNYLIPGNFGAVSLSRRFKDASDSWMYRVPVLTLDSISFAKCPSLLKMDVELMEVQVLRGARHLLTRCKPIIYAENNCIHTSPALVEELYALGYVPYWDSNAPMNMICIPRNRLKGVEVGGAGAGDTGGGYFLEEVEVEAEVQVGEEGQGGQGQRGRTVLQPRFRQLGNFTHCHSVIPTTD
ncbi:S-adenosyl-L-methionine-dependent methyltransferase [Ochromonadaceae sp. CCMP2298]|nr:S-adenosyl-L-methionine-dependent methyltransferase [Ochromonadaceae sp. CCMP2298]